MVEAVVPAVPWRPAGSSVRGAVHKRRALPNQDAIGWTIDPEQNVAVIAVADGHGSAASYRSDVGSALAVSCALHELRTFCAAHRARASAEVRALAADNLPRNVLTRWKELVRQHLASNTLSADLNDPLRVYGSTLLAAAVTPDWLIVLQIGDGDILLVSESGTAHRAFPRDSRLLGVETTSLCTTRAENDVQIRVVTLSGRTPPAMVMLSTDGYSNSFRDEAGFLRVGPDLLAMIRQDGIRSVESALGGWLNESSEQGSGDDISVGMLVHTGPVEASAHA